MSTIAYIYCEPLLEPPADPAMWGLEIDRVYIDLGKRDSLRELLADSQSHPPSYLLLRRLDELGDSLTEISDRLTMLESLGVQIIAIDQPYSSSQINNSDPGAIKAELAKLLQEIQRNQVCRRIQAGHARNRLDALPPPGRAPYGYRRGKDRYIIDRSTAPIVKDFCDRFLLFGSLRGAVRYLEKKYGKKIAVSTGRRWLTNPVYRGDLAYRNREIIPNTHVAVISREEAAQIDRLLRRNTRLPRRSASAPRSLAGLVFCQQCQSAMTITKVTTRGKNKREYLYLRPINCSITPKCSAIPYQQVLTATIDLICQELPQAVEQIKGDNLDGIKVFLRTEIKQKQENITQLASLIEKGILDEDTAKLRRYKISTEIAQLEDKLAQLPPGNLIAIAQTVSLSQFWLDLSEAERRFYFREFLRRIEILRLDRNSWKLQLKFIF
jgi:DNA invertase Pin-like site-specific DNA recombinase